MARLTQAAQGLVTLDRGELGPDHLSLYICGPKMPLAWQTPSSPDAYLFPPDRLGTLWQK